MTWLLLFFIGLEIAVTGCYCSNALDQIAKRLREIAYQMEIKK